MAHLICQGIFRGSNAGARWFEPSNVHNIVFNT